MTIKRLFWCIISAICVLAASATESADTTAAKWKYIPQVHGTMRAMYEWSTVTGKSNFLVRNARISAGGFILPRTDYFLQVDFCNKGKISLLDAYIRIAPAQGLQLYAGQMRVPFSIGSSRMPKDYHFSHSAAVGWLGNLRSVGAKAGYRRGIFYVEGGVFNGTDKASHTGWNSQLTYSARANVSVAGFMPQIAFMSRTPGGQDSGVRFNQGNASLTWQDEHWFVEGEYIYRTYTNGADPSRAFAVFVDYGFPVKWEWANRLSFQGRFDGVTDIDNNPGFKRLTAGTTAHYGIGNIFIDFRINYEHFFYAVDTTPDPYYNSRLNTTAIVYF